MKTMANLAAFTMSDFKMLGATAESGQMIILDILEAMGCNWKPEWLLKIVCQSKGNHEETRKDNQESRSWSHLKSIEVPSGELT